MKIGDQLQKQRKIHDMSQDSLAKKLHISRQSISKWENGASLPSFSNIMAISRIFNISLDELIKGDDDLMNKLENSKGINNLIYSIIGSFAVGISLWFLLKYTGLYNNLTIKMLLTLGIVISFIMLMSNINWKNIRQVITHKAIFWLIIFFILSLIPKVNNFLIGFNIGYHSFH
ncbi:helix-turn-helix transcriptional regulator [Companilactobacillus musae]|uniref:helix-turn-helix domain-containing protein n=1 Tax=Companilactobacillus musae TaxID=1903258 RepID=UPI0013C2C7B1|nr:helix-turn-helix transcriptional regulator [Companilactobacillus musae]